MLDRQESNSIFRIVPSGDPWEREYKKIRDELSDNKKRGSRFVSLESFVDHVSGYDPKSTYVVGQEPDSETTNLCLETIARRKMLPLNAVRILASYSLYVDENTPFHYKVFRENTKLVNRCAIGLADFEVLLKKHGSLLAKKLPKDILLTDG